MESSRADPHKTTSVRLSCIPSKSFPVCASLTFFWRLVGRYFRWGHKDPSSHSVQNVMSGWNISFRKRTTAVHSRTREHVYEMANALGRLVKMTTDWFLRSRLKLSAGTSANGNSKYNTTGKIEPSFCWNYEDLQQGIASSRSKLSLQVTNNNPLVNPT